MSHDSVVYRVRTEHESGHVTYRPPQNGVFFSTFRGAKNAAKQSSMWGKTSIERGHVKWEAAEFDGD